MLFKFKEFFINQAQSAMKVGTDGVLLGAWAEIPANTKHALDIGTGTGLIALMLAQRCEAKIDAVELDEYSVRDAEGNIADSPWSDRISLYHDSIQHFSQHKKQYDLIISNPPFFKAGKARNAARHTLSLSHEDLIRAVGLLLAPKGIFCLVLPLKEGYEFLEIAHINGLFPQKTTQVIPRFTKQPNRLLLQLCRDEFVNCTKNSLTIREGDGYTDEYLALTDDFYLGL